MDPRHQGATPEIKKSSPRKAKKSKVLERIYEEVRKLRQTEIISWRRDWGRRR